ncbi:MAG: hypothetical protein LBN41_10350 [Enterobacteriaceae bacterium]|jgi:hypothetical protein|nr:hypothetical protein [Enterobacteriaceae bacterium]
MKIILTSIFITYLLAMSFAVVVNAIRGNVDMMDSTSDYHYSATNDCLIR